MEDVRCCLTVHSDVVGTYEAVRAAANGRTLEVVPHCRPVGGPWTSPGRDAASSSLKLTDV